MALLLLFGMGGMTEALAGPPYVTDDPEPTPFGHVETYLFSNGTMDTGEPTDQEAGFEINVGALPNLQLSAETSLARSPEGGFGLGTSELGAKYRFIQEDSEGWTPQVSFYPQTEFSLGGASGTTHYLFPLWAQKSVGAWTVFGGGGYRVNPGRDERNSWLGGLALQHSLNDTLSVGGELYGETADSYGQSGRVGFGVGAIQEIDENFEILASGGPVLGGSRAGFAYYLALGWHR